MTVGGTNYKHWPIAYIVCTLQLTEILSHTYATSTNLLHAVKKSKRQTSKSTTIII